MGTISGTAGNDTLTGTSGADLFKVWQGGDDVVSGLGGNDVFNFIASFNANDSVDGGTGTDTLLLRGDYSAGVTFGAGTMVNVEAIKLAAGFDYNLTTNDATVAAGQTLGVNAATLGAGNALTFDGSAELDGRFIVKGGAGDDALTGGAGNDIFRLENGGSDTASGGAGDDLFVMGASLTAGDRIDGGAGHNTVRLDGDYSGGLTLGADTIQNIHALQFDAGHSYNITADANNFLSGSTVLIEGQALGAGDSLTFDGSAVDANIHFTGGAGNDVLTGGTGANVFDLSHGGADTVTGGSQDDHFLFGQTLNAGDTIDGGAGADTVDMTGMDGGDSITFGADTFTSVETLKLEAGQSYDLRTVDGNVAAGATLLVNAAGLGSGNTLSFNGSAETDGHFIIRGGAGNDTLTGGAQSDTFNLTFGGTDTASGGAGDDLFSMGGAMTAADHIDGGAGNDTVNLDGDYSTGLTFGATTMTNVETLSFVTGHAYDITTDNATVASGQTLTVDASGLTGGGDSIVFDGLAETDGNFHFISGVAGDFMGGAGADIFDLGNATANVDAHGENGNDTFNFAGNMQAGDGIDGGAGNDTVILSGDYSAGLTFGAGTMTNVENLILGAGHDYDLTTNDATVGNTSSLTINMVALGTGHTLTLDGSAETDGFLIVTAGASFTAADSFVGGSRGNLLILNGDYSGGLTFGATTIEHVGNIELGDASGSSYNLTMNDANVASGGTLSVDGSALTTGTLTFNGAAETDGSFTIAGGASDDVLIGGQAGDSFTGGGGADTMTAGAAHNFFDYTGASDSTSTTHDTIIGFDAANDKFHFQGSTVGGYDGILTGSVSTASFDSDLSGITGSDALLAGHACVVHANAGTLSGHDFLVVDISGHGQYSAGNDIVIDITGYSGTVSTSDFI